MYALDPRTLEIRNKVLLPTNVNAVAVGRTGVIYTRSGERVVSAVRINGPDDPDNPKPSEVLWQFDLATYGGERLAVGTVTTAGQKLEQVYFTDEFRVGCSATRAP